LGEVAELVRFTAQMSPSHHSLIISQVMAPG
jgi:hypothetical protein